MSTQREIIYSVRNVLRAGVTTDDDAITDRQIAFLIDATRASLLRQQYNKGQNLSDNNIQTIPCMQVELVDASLMPDVPSNCKVYKTTLTVPKFIESKGKDLITGISGPKIGALGYDLIPYTRLPYAASTMFPRPKVTIFNNYIYLIDAPFTMNIAVSGVFEKPSELEEYNNCEGSPCFSFDSNYPMSAHLIDPVIKMVVEQLTLTLKVPTDRTNSGAHELESQLNSNQAQTGQKGQR
jgi:hypothetical protein